MLFRSSIQNFFTLNIGFEAFVKSLGITLFSFVTPQVTDVYYSFIKDLVDATEEMDDKTHFFNFSMTVNPDSVFPDHDPMGTLGTVFHVFSKALDETIIETESYYFDIALAWDNADDRPVASHSNMGTPDDTFIVFNMGVPDSDSTTAALDDDTSGGNVPIYFTKYISDTDSTVTETEYGYLFKDPYDQGGFFADLTYNAGLQQTF